MSDLSKEIDDIMKQALSDVKDELLCASNLVMHNAVDALDRADKIIKEQRGFIDELLKGNELLLDALKNCRLNHG